MIRRYAPIGFVVSFFVEFGPTLAFFLVSHRYGFFTGAVVLVALTALALVFSLLRDRRIALFALISSVLILAFGLMTILLWDPRWLYIEYTLYNGLFGIALLWGYVRGKGLLKPLFGSMFLITERGWKVLSLRWGFVFLTTAILNEYVWRSFSGEAWVDFRFATAVLQCAFGFSQFFLARRERLPEASEWGLRQ